MVKKANLIKSKYLEKMLKIIDAAIKNYKLIKEDDDPSLISEILISEFLPRTLVSQSMAISDDVRLPILARLEMEGFEIVDSITQQYNFMQQEYRELLELSFLQTQQDSIFPFSSSTADIVTELVEYVMQNLSSHIQNDLFYFDESRMMTIDEFEEIVRIYFNEIYVEGMETTSINERIQEFINNLINNEHINGSILSSTIRLNSLKNFLEQYSLNEEMQNEDEVIERITSFIFYQYNIEGISSLISDDIDNFSSTIYNQVRLYLRRIFIDEDISGFVDPQVIENISHIIGTLDNPQSILAMEYNLHLRRLETLSVQYDTFSPYNYSLSEHFVEEFNPVESLGMTWDFENIIENSL